eukprot:scaffold7369_cov61-Phaeocystis_antarctica.AAC.4
MASHAKCTSSTPDEQCATIPPSGVRPVTACDQDKPVSVGSMLLCCTEASATCSGHGAWVRVPLHSEATPSRRRISRPAVAYRWYRSHTNAASEPASAARGGGSAAAAPHVTSSVGAESAGGPRRALDRRCWPERWPEACTEP